MLIICHFLTLFFLEIFSAPHVRVSGVRGKMGWRGERGEWIERGKRAERGKGVSELRSERDVLPLRDEL